jgi:hypothetical protein
MPPLPPTPNVLVMQLNFAVTRASVLSRVHVKYTSAAPSRDDLITYAASIDAEIAAHLPPLCSTQVKTSEVMVAELTGQYGARGIATSGRKGTLPGLPNDKPRVYIPCSSRTTGAVTVSDLKLISAATAAPSPPG